MKIDTKYHGEAEIKEQDIWKFEKGIPGFPSENEFIILSFLENDVYAILQSIKTPDLGFVITNPFLFFPSYKVEIDDATIAQLTIEKETDILVYTILTIQEPFESTTANLQAPLIMNRKNMLAKQYILNDGEYKTKHTILPAKVEKG